MSNTRAAIIMTGLDLWRQGSEADVSARRIGKLLGMSHAGCLYHWGSAEAMRRAIADYAVQIGDRAVVPKLIVSGHPAVAQMPATDRHRYLVHLRGN